MVVMAVDRARTQWEWPRGLEKMTLGFGDVLNMSWGSSIYSSSDQNAL